MNKTLSFIFIFFFSVSLSFAATDPCEDFMDSDDVSGLEAIIRDPKGTELSKKLEAVRLLGKNDSLQARLALLNALVYPEISDVVVEELSKIDPPKELVSPLVRLIQIGTNAVNFIHMRAHPNPEAVVKALKAVVAQLPVDSEWAIDGREAIRDYESRALETLDDGQPTVIIETELPEMFSDAERAIVDASLERMNMSDPITQAFIARIEKGLSKLNPAEIINEMRQEGKDSITPLVEILKGDNVVAKQRASLLLNEIGIAASAHIVTYISSSYFDELKLENQVWFVALLGAIGAQENVDFLIAIMAHKRKFALPVRQAAAKALETIRENAPDDIQIYITDAVIDSRVFEEVSAPIRQDASVATDEDAQKLLKKLEDRMSGASAGVDEAVLFEGEVIADLIAEHHSDIDAFTVELDIRQHGDIGRVLLAYEKTQESPRQTVVELVTILEGRGSNYLKELSMFILASMGQRSSLEALMGYLKYKCMDPVLRQDGLFYLQQVDSLDHVTAELKSSVRDFVSEFEDAKIVRVKEPEARAAYPVMDALRFYWHMKMQINVWGEVDSHYLASRLGAKSEIFNLNVVRYFLQERGNVLIPGFIKAAAHPGVRAHMIDVLRDFRTPEIMSLAVQGLMDSDDAVKDAAMNAFKDWQLAVPIKIVEKMKTQFVALFDNFEENEFAIEAMEIAFSELDWMVFKEMKELSNHPDKNIRASVMDILGEMKSPFLKNVFVRALKEDPSPEVRRQSVRALMALNTSNQLRVKFTGGGKYKLGAPGDKKTKKANNKDVDLIAESEVANESSEAEILADVMHNVGELNQLFFEQLKSDDSPLVNEQLLKAVHMLGSAEALDVVKRLTVAEMIESLLDPRPETRMRAQNSLFLRSLYIVDRPMVALKLISFVRAHLEFNMDTYEAVRSAIDVLSNIHDDHAEDFLLDLLSNANFSMLVASKLTRQGRRFVPKLLRKLKSSDHYVRFHAFTILYEMPKQVSLGDNLTLIVREMLGKYRDVYPENYDFEETFISDPQARERLHDLITILILRIENEY